MNYGYCRVSSAEQILDRQIVSIKAAIGEGRIFTDKQSGKDFERDGYKAMKKKLKAGDVLFIHSLDRFGRNYDEIIQEWSDITKKIGADIVVLDMPLLDTRTSGENGLVGRFISDLVLQILSFVAETERENIRKRQAEGIAIAKAKGIKFGRPERLIPENFEEIVKKVRDKEITGIQAAHIIGMPVSTFYYKASNYDYYTRRDRT